MNASARSVIVVLAVVAFAALLADCSSSSDPGGDPRSETGDVTEASAAPSAETVDPDPVPALPEVAFVDVGTGRVSRPPRVILRTLNPVYEFEFQVAPDGKRLAFVDTDDGIPRIHVAGLDGSHDRIVATGGVSPAWSPDGGSIAYVEDGQTIRVVDLVTLVSRTLVSSEGRVWLPSFRPDGRVVLFTRESPEGGSLGLVEVPVAGGRLERIAGGAAFGVYSPDGAIAFHATLHAVDVDVWPFDFGLRLLEPGRERARRLVGCRGCGGWTMAPFDWDWTRPAWSPSGTRVAYQRFGTMPDTITVFDLTTGSVTNLGTGSLPTWLDDDTLIVEDYDPREEGTP